MNTTLKRIPKTAWGSFRAFLRYQGINQAAALAFFALLSFIPLMFLIVAVAGIFLGDTQAVQDFIKDQLSNVAPLLQETIEQRINKLLGMAKGLGLMSLGFILWTSGLFFSALQTSLLLPWIHEHGYKKPKWRYVFPWLAGPVLGILMIGAMLFMTVASYIPTGNLPIKVVPEFWSWLILALLIFLFYNLLLPRRRTPGATAILSLILSAASLAITFVFVHIFSSMPNYALVYGSLAAVILFLLWLNYNMALLLLGGHFIRLWGKKGVPPVEQDPIEDHKDETDTSDSQDKV
jgi:membrane protein